jgi:hypothetical protein
MNKMARATETQRDELTNTANKNLLRGDHLSSADS